MNRRNDEYLTVSDAAHESGISAQTIYKALQAGDLPGESIYNRIVIRREDLEEWRRGIPQRDKVRVLDGRVNFSIELDELNKARKLAARRRVTLSEYCRIALENQNKEEAKRNG